MDQAAAAFDPLAMLEAEYAAVLAQTKSPEASASLEPVDDAESAGSESEKEESGGFENYALLPSSPCNSDDETPDYEDNEGRPPNSKIQEASAQQEDVKRQEEDKKLAIMKSMQKVTLRPPPWAEAANLTDDELLNMVQKQLGLQHKLP